MAYGPCLSGMICSKCRNGKRHLHAWLPLLYEQISLQSYSTCIYAFASATSFTLPLWESGTYMSLRRKWQQLDRQKCYRYVNETKFYLLPARSWKTKLLFYQSRKLNSKHFTSTEEKVKLRQKLRDLDFFLTHRKYITDLTS